MLTGNDGQCKLCNYGIEDVTHFLFICEGLKCIRIDEYKKLELLLVSNNFFYAWELFISSDLVTKLSLTLGDNSFIFSHNDNDNMHAHNIFDKFCKSYVKRAWELRT